MRKMDLNHMNIILIYSQNGFYCQLMGRFSLDQVRNGGLFDLLVLDLM